jgi:hypothetical protein
MLQPRVNANNFLFGQVSITLHREEFKSENGYRGKKPQTVETLAKAFNLSVFFKATL